MKFKKSLPYLLPSLTGLSVFYLIPFLLSLYYALINNMSNKKFVGLQNFITTVQNQMFQKGLLNTTVFMLISIPVLIVIALLFALLLKRMPRGQGILMAVLMFPIIIPSGVTAHFWKSIFDINGLINKALYSLEHHIPLEKYRICSCDFLRRDEKNSDGILRTRQLHRSKPVATISPHYMDLSFSDHICRFDFVIYKFFQNI